VGCGEWGVGSGEWGVGWTTFGERQHESYPPLASLDPPEGRVKSLSLWESRPERPERGCITLVVFSLPFALRPFLEA